MVVKMASLEHFIGGTFDYSCRYEVKISSFYVYPTVSIGLCIWFEVSPPSTCVCFRFFKLFF